MKDERLKMKNERLKIKVDWARIALASNEPYFRGRRNGTLRASKRHFAGVETALSRPSKRNATETDE